MGIAKQNIIWGNCLEIIRDNISLSSYNTWFAVINPIKFESNILTIQVPSHFFYEWLEEYYVDLLRKVIKKVIGSQAKLEYSIVMDKSNVRNKPDLTVKIPAKAVDYVSSSKVSKTKTETETTIVNPFQAKVTPKVYVDSNLNSNYTLGRFIEGDCNRLAKSAASAVSLKPGGTAFNPLVLISGVGLGKTHLSQSIGLEVQRLFPDKTVLYVNADVFTKQFVDSIKNHTTNDFINFYKLIDLLIVDDIQFFVGKAKTQDAFYHVFNHFHQSGKQIVLSSDVAPKDMKGMEQRLLSRFKWGLTVDLELPNKETRLEIFKDKIYNSGIELSDDVINCLASRVNTNVREMEGVLNAVIAQSTLSKEPVTIKLVEKLVGRYVKNVKKDITINYIHKTVCDYFKVPESLLLTKTRKRDVVQARQIAMFFSKQMTDGSLASIGEHFGGKDHGTVIYACKTVSNLSEIDKQYRGYIDDIRFKLEDN